MHVPSWFPASSRAPLGAPGRLVRPGAALLPPETGSYGLAIGYLAKLVDDVTLLATDQYGTTEKAAADKAAAEAEAERLRLERAKLEQSNTAAVPVWAWAAGAVALVLLLRRRRHA